MELIKKTVLRVMTTGTTTGCTGGSCVVIIPDTGITYYFNININGVAENIGFFNAYDFSGVTGTTITPTFITITGGSSSRLSELRKYVVSGTTAQIYVTGGNWTTDGVDLGQTSGSTYVYYLGGIQYTDLLTGFTSGTTFTFTGQGYSNPEFINKPIYQDPNKEIIISNPKILDDVFIVRQELSAFDKNYRLEYVRTLNDLETYAGGAFFNIINNT